MTDRSGCQTLLSVAAGSAPHANRTDKTLTCDRFMAADLPGRSGRRSQTQEVKGG